jgi:hypothetical protein
VESGIVIKWREKRVHVRRPGEPEECQRDVYRKLGVDSMDALPVIKTQTPPHPEKSKL